MTIGIIGGSGLSKLDGLEGPRAFANYGTPYGPASGPITIGSLRGKDVVFLPRHGEHHNIPPHKVNAAANIFALKELGCEWVIAVSAVGSLVKEIEPGHLVVVDQFIDRTNRPNVAKSLFDEMGIVTHVSMADPVSPQLSSIIRQELMSSNATYGRYWLKGTYVVMDGPQFSTRAESELHRKWGANVIGMTAMPEAKLAREAELSYALIAMATDYDCWDTAHSDVTAADVVKVMQSNVEKVKRLIGAVIEQIPIVRTCLAAKALDGAIMTPRSAWPPTSRFLPLLNRYMRDNL